MTYFKCPVCNHPLSKEGKTFRCEANHSYDIAKKGYVNLLLANQGNHLLEEGDKKESIEARVRFLSSGAYAFLLENIIKIFGRQQIHSFVDLACGEGYYTTAIHQALNIEQTYGVDISKSAIQSACSKRNAFGIKNIEYAIGNLDYLPFLDGSFDALLNCFAPINENEFARVAKPGAIYIRVLPGAKHLLEMKQSLYENVRLNEPKEESLPGFSLLGKETVTRKEVLTNQQIKDLFEMTPYAHKTKPEAKEKLFLLNELETTLEFVLYIYQKD